MSSVTPGHCCRGWGLSSPDRTTPWMLCRGLNHVEPFQGNYGEESTDQGGLLVRLYQASLCASLLVNSNR